MNTPKLTTERLILRRFEEKDIPALFEILKDEEVNTFLPWFPLRSLGEAREFYEKRYRAVYELPQGYRYAVCLKEDDVPFGYIDIKTDASHDLGYGLKKQFWQRGIATEAGRALLDQAKADGLPYVTATHDVRNFRSGAVMKRLGMAYRYSYNELVQPKNERVTFRMYQINFGGEQNFVFRGYAEETFIEPGV